MYCTVGGGIFFNWGKQITSVDRQNWAVVGRENGVTKHLHTIKTKVKSGRLYKREALE